jgi:hypothetical protein
VAIIEELRRRRPLDGSGYAGHWSVASPEAAAQWRYPDCYAMASCRDGRTVLRSAKSGPPHQGDRCFKTPPTSCHFGAGPARRRAPTARSAGLPAGATKLSPPNTTWACSNPRTQAEVVEPVAERLARDGDAELTHIGDPTAHPAGRCSWRKITSRLGPARSRVPTDISNGRCATSCCCEAHVHQGSRCLSTGLSRAIEAR